MACIKKRDRGTHGRTHARTDRQPETNMPRQLLRRWGHNTVTCAPSEHLNIWSESSLSTLRNTGSIVILKERSEGSDQAGRLPRSILSPYLTGLRLLATNCERHSRGSFQNVSKGLRVFSFPRMGRRDSLTCRWNLRFFLMFKKFARQIFSQNSHRVVAGVSNPSRILLQFSFRESESARQLCEWLATYETKMTDCRQNIPGASVVRLSRECPVTFALYVCEHQANFDCLETKMRTWHTGHECRTTIAWESRDIRAICMRTAGELWQYMYSQMCRKVSMQCDSKWKVSEIRVFSRSLCLLSQLSEILATDRSLCWSFIIIIIHTLI